MNIKEIMSVTIIIPTVGEPTLERVVQSAKKQIPEAEIIVVGFGSSKVVAENNLVSFLDTEIKTPKSIGINRAVSLAKNDRIIVLDADAIPINGWGINMLAAFEKGYKIFSGSVNISEGNLWMKVYNFSYFHEFLPENLPGYKLYLPAISMGFTKQTFYTCGNWDETLIRSQDYEWTLRLSRAGFKPYFIPAASIIHLPSSQNTFKKVWNSWLRNGYENYKVRKEFSDLLKTPKILEIPILVLLLSPLLALSPTLRILRTSPSNFWSHLHLIPFVYITKIAWCVGVFNASRK
jgi:glycosyltransferase involved in cell wall biosynthesis